jgi:hypothetical protein
MPALIVGFDDISHLAKSTAIAGSQICGHLIRDGDTNFHVATHCVQFLRIEFYRLEQHVIRNAYFADIVQGRCIPTSSTISGGYFAVDKTCNSPACSEIYLWAHSTKVLRLLKERPQPRAVVDNSQASATD